MFKKQALAFLAALTLVGGAQALGLGDIELNSNLNEPLDARIELLEPSDLSANEILPTLASRLAFEQAGIERDFFLSNIRFDVQPAANGGLVIQLSTSQAVREPFLNFLVEVNWPGGRLLKEYTLLLDPPLFDTGAQSQAPSVAPARTPRPSVSQPSAPAARQYRVARNDTLWEIALRVNAGAGYMPQQVMLAIQDLNPDAFINNNINRLKAGAVLTLPNRAQIAARSRQLAINEVGQQNVQIGLSENGRQPTQVQLSATESTNSALPQGEAERDPDGYLEVTTDDDTDGSSAGGDLSNQADVERLENELAIAGELNDQFERENQAMEARLAELEEQLAIMQRMLNLQGGDTAALQAELAELDDTEQAVTDIEPEAETEAETDTDSAWLDWATIKEQYSILWQELLDVIDTAIDWVMDSQRNMIIAGVAALLLLGLPLFIASRLGGGGNDSVDFPDDDDLDDGEDLLDRDDEDAVSDAIREAEMYMAYHNYERAEEVLQPWLYDAPERSDLGLKLLEVYATSDDIEAFDDLSERLPLTADERALAEAMRERMTLNDFDDDLGASSDVLDEAPSPRVFNNLVDDEDDFSAEPAPLDDLPIEDLNLADLNEPDDTEEDTDEADFELDLGDLDGVDELEEDDDSGLDFELSDLGLEASDDDELMSPASESEASDDEFDYDLDDDLDSDLDNDVGPIQDELDSSETPVLDDDESDFDLDDVKLSGPADASLPDWDDEESEVALPAGAELEDDEYDFLSGADEASTKLDLARAYMEMDDADGARDILEEVLTEGNDDQQRQAQELIDRL